MRKILPYIFSLLLLGTLAAMGVNGGFASGSMPPTFLTDTPDTLLPAPVDTLRGETPDDHFRALFIEAVRQRLLNNDTEAIALMQQCQQLQPQAAEVYYLLYDYYYGKNELPQALDYIRQACALDTANVRYLQSFANQLLQAEKYEECVPIMEKISQLLRSDTQTLDVLFNLYKMLDNSDKALATLNRIEAIEGSKLDNTLNKMNILEAQGKPQAAFDEMKKLIADHPYDYNLPVLAGNWLMGHDRQDEAYTYYTSVLNDDPHNEEALLSMVDYYNEREQKQQADSLEEALLFSKKTSTETRTKILNMRIMQDMRQHKDSTLILAFTDKVIASDPTNTELRRYIASYMQYIKVDSTLLQAQLDTLLMQDPTDVWARIVSIQNKWAEGKFNEVIQMSTEGTQYSPEEMAFYYFLGIAYFNKNDHDRALDALQRGTTQINKNSNEEFVADFYAMMGDIYHEKHLDDKAFQAYDSCLHWQPEHLPCLNNYAYYLSQKGTDLDRAETMSAKTVKAEPDNPTYLDTYAWVLFTLGRYEDARPYIEHALELVENDKGIYLEHAGDIYAMLGQTDKAVDMWRQAEQTDAGNKLLKKKIKRKQYLTK